MKTTALCVLLLFFSGTIAGVSLAKQPEDKPSAIKEASDAYDAKDLQEAARLYQEIVEKEPGNSRMWYRLATSLHGIGQEAKALTAYKKSIEVGLPAMLGEYQIGLVYASLKENEKSLEFLQKAAVHGFAQPERIETDQELAALHGDPRFPKLVQEVKRNERPCAYTAENRQFDFWLGEWDVVVTNGGTPAGTSKIELILGDCVVQENWTGGSSGKSYNIYNQSLKRWEQYWVDSVGGNIFFYGELKGGVMDYWTDAIPQPDGTKLKRHLQFFKMGPDTVRQFSQGSTDDGQTWHVEYDFTYNRKK